MASVKLKGICKRYDKDVIAVKDFTLSIEDKEFVVLVGPSGCGKSTTLRMIAGLEEISDGELYINDRLVNHVEPKDRDIAMVFQNYALYPHMTVYDNLGFALKLRKESKDKIKEKVYEAAKILSIQHLLKRKPGQLSGGERQRVAIGRAIVRNPQVFLMDEPLSNLDAKMRTQMRAEIIKLHKRFNTTFIYVTHDQIEAMTLGTRIVVMKDGIIQQTDTPQVIFDNPINTFVAGFIGTPQMNFILEAKLLKDNDQFFIHMMGADFLLPESKQAELRSCNTENSEITVGIRPENLCITRSGEGMLQAKVDLSEMMGNEAIVHVKIAKEGFDIDDLGEEESIVEEDNTNTNWINIIIKLRDATFNQTGKIGITLDVNKLHIFDKETGFNLINKRNSRIK